MSWPKSPSKTSNNRSKMICVYLKGGLGNQLFQYAAGRALSIKHETSLLLDTSAYQTIQRSVTQRTLQLNHFNHMGKSIERYDRPLNVFRHLPLLSKWLSSWDVRVESSDGENTTFSEFPDRTYLVGYWQNYHYFHSISAILYNDFAPIHPLSSLSRALENEINERGKSSIALHVRRGDYVSLSSAANFHGALPSTYYEGATRYLRERVESPHFYVFSDSIEWCEANLNFKPHEVTFVAHNNCAGAWEDLILMASCRHIVIANSTFSWWSAWLGDQKVSESQRIVIAPKRWFVNREIMKPEERFPIHWHLF
jgi:hypothetical protein